MRYTNRLQLLLLLLLLLAHSLSDSLTHFGDLQIWPFDLEIATAVILWEKKIIIIWTKLFQITHFNNVLHNENVGK